MKAGKNCRRQNVLIAGILSFLAAAVPVAAAALEQEQMLSATEEAQIRPIGDGTDRYLLKSEGFFCLNGDGTRCDTAEVHYFDHMEIDGTVLNGFYYHDDSGRFRAESPHVVQIKGCL